MSRILTASLFVNGPHKLATFFLCYTHPEIKNVAMK